MWDDLIEGMRLIIGVIDDLLFEQLPFLIDRYITQLPIWAVGMTLTVLVAAVIFMTLVPTKRGDMANVGVTMVTSFAVKASKGLFTLGFYGSILLVFTIVIMRNTS